MDMTSGFHQTLLDEKSRKYSAFATPGNIIYEFLRVSKRVNNARAKVLKKGGRE